MSNDLIIALSALSVAVAIGIALLLTWLAGGIEKKQAPMKVRVVLCVVDILADDWEVAE